MKDYVQAEFDKMLQRTGGLSEKDIKKMRETNEI